MVETGLIVVPTRTAGPAVRVMAPAVAVPVRVALPGPIGPRGEAGPAGPRGRDGGERSLPIIIATADQRAIPLPEPPLDPMGVVLTVNGIAYRVPFLSVSDVALTWPEDAFPLDPSDIVMLTYR